MRTSRLLSGYIAKHFLTVFLSVMLVISGLILLFDVIELARRAASRSEAGFGLLLLMGLMKLPNMINALLPFAVMIAAMMTFWRLTKSAELVVARAAGLSVWQFLTPVLIASFLIGLFNITAINPLAAGLYTRYERMQDTLLLRRSNPLALSETGLWLRESQGESHMVLHADSVRQEGLVLHMSNVSLFIFDENNRFQKRVNGTTGTLEPGSFHVRSAWLMEPGKPSFFHPSYDIPTALTISKIQENFSSPDTISFWQLPGFIRFFEKAGFSAHRQWLHLYALIASPFLLCAMVLVAALFSVKPNLRGGGLLKRLGGGVAAGFGLYFFSKIVYALGLSATLPVMLAAWSPALLAGLIGVAGLLHFEDG